MNIKHQPMVSETPTQQNQLPVEHLADGQWGDWLIEVYPGSSLRDLRMATLGLAYHLSQPQHASRKGLVVLAGSRISPDSLRQESRRLAAVLRPDLASRMTVLNGDDGLQGLLSEDLAPPELLTMQFDAYVHELIQQELARARPYGAAPGSAKDVVLEHLMLSWLEQAGPMSAADLQLDTGVSYPTVAAVIRELEGDGLVGRGHKRSVQLLRFPWQHWRNWLARMVSSRKTIVYKSTTNLPRHNLTMIDRLRRLERSDVAVGGTLGAARHYPRLDVVGTPRLDLVVLGEPKDFGPQDVARLDPSLDPLPSPAGNGDLAVHFIGRRKSSHFLSVDGVPYADPLQCLADLYDMGLEAPARDMLEGLVDARSKKQDSQHPR